MIPHFPPLYEEENNRAFSSSPSGAVAHASGSCIHFSYFLNDSLQRSYSINPTRCTVKSLSFHSKSRLLAIGDIEGRVLLFDCSTKVIIANTAKMYSCAVIHLEWRENVLLVLFSDKKLVAFAQSAGVTQTTRNLIVVWEISLPILCTRFSIDPFHSRILFSSNASQFLILDHPNVREAPIEKSSPITLSNTSVKILDAQWSYHMPHYIYVFLETGLYFFHTASEAFIPLIDLSVTPGAQVVLIQSKIDHTHLWLLYKSGTIVTVLISKPYILSKERETVVKYTEQQLISGIFAPFTQTKLILLFNPLGLALFDLSKSMIQTILPLHAHYITAIANNGKNYALGTKDGKVIYGDLYDTTKTKLFKCSSQPISFVSVCPVNIYYHDSKTVGSISLDTRSVTQLSGGKFSFTRARGSNFGALAIQHDPIALGVYIAGKEVPILCQSEIIDFCFDSSNSSATDGGLALLLQSKEIHFCRYTANCLTKPPMRMRFNPNAGDPTTIAWSGNCAAVGSTTGMITIINFEAQNILSQSLISQPIARLSIYDNTISGLSNANTLFCLNEGVKTLANEKTATICHITKNELMAIDFHGYCHILDTQMTPLPMLSTAYPLPSRDDLIAAEINDGKMLFISPEGLDMHYYLNNFIPLRLTNAAAVGDSVGAELINSHLLMRINEQTRAVRNFVFTSLMFSNAFEKAAEYLTVTDPNDPEFLVSSLIGTVALTPELTSLQQQRLRQTAGYLMKGGYYEAGARILRLAREDKKAADFLIQLKKSDMAMRFAKCCADFSDKKDILFRIGCEKVEEGKVREAFELFLAAEELHAALFCVFSLGEIIDSFYLKMEATKIGRLVAVSGERAQMFTSLIELNELAEIIDDQFKAEMLRINVDPSKFFK